jgi:hypothetical protein
VEREGGSENGGEEGGEDGGEQAKQDYVKKEFAARPYVSTFNTENEVRSLTTKNTRY